jgi:hypothetical protein
MSVCTHLNAIKAVNPTIEKSNNKISRWSVKYIDTKIIHAVIKVSSVIILGPPKMIKIIMILMTFKMLNKQRTYFSSFWIVKFFS